MLLLRGPELGKVNMRISRDGERERMTYKCIGCCLGAGKGVRKDRIIISHITYLPLLRRELSPIGLECLQVQFGLLHPR
jgi:hypothetical protein